MQGTRTAHRGHAPVLAIGPSQPHRSASRNYSSATTSGDQYAGNRYSAGHPCGLSTPSAIPLIWVSSSWAPCRYGEPHHGVPSG